MAEICDLFEDTTSASGSMPRAVILPAAPLENAGTGADAITSVIMALFNASGTLADRVTDTRGFLLVSAGVLSGHAMNALTRVDLLTDRATLRETVFAVNGDLVAVAGTVADAVIQNRMADRVRDAAVATDRVIGTAWVTNLVTERARGIDKLFTSRVELVKDAAVGAVTVITRLRAVDLVTVTGALADATFQTATVHQLVQANGTLASYVSQQLDALQLVKDEAEAAGSIVAGATGTAWTATTDSLGMSRYQLPSISSAAAVGGELALTGKDGVFLRGGTTDAGALIHGYVQTGLDDFDSEYLKRPGHLYVAYTSEATLSVTVGETSTGTEASYDYTMPARPATATTQGRTLLGQGMRSLMFRFTFHTTDGKAMSLSAAHVDLFNTSRKV